MDLQMPVMGGFESATKILEILRERGVDNCTIVALTSNTTQQDKERAISCGMKEVIHKPLSSAKLRECLTNYYYIQ